MQLMLLVAAVILALGAALATAAAILSLFFRLISRLL
jgi:hypothetical protein